MAKVSVVTGVCLQLSIDGGDTIEIHEGDTFTNMVYTEGSQDVSIPAGRIRIVNATVKNVVITHTCPPTSYFDKLVDAVSIVVDKSSQYDAELVTVPIEKLVSIETVTHE